jgi:putative FmdB family regulatory protein
MPIYEYQCRACGERFELIAMSPSERPKKVSCPACDSSDVQRLFSPPAVRVGGKSDVEREKEEPAAKPELFGRKELNQALRNRS